MSLRVENPANKKPLEVKKPDPPAVEVVRPADRDPPEPPQIKGPVELPKRKEEEAQLDRPGAGKEAGPTLDSSLDFEPVRMRDVLFRLPRRCGARGRGAPP